MIRFFKRVIIFMLLLVAIPTTIFIIKAQLLGGNGTFSVLLLGVDTGEYGREDTGRSDIIVAATINPKTNKTIMTSIPRDTYTEIVGEGYNDKINHAYAFGGKEMSEATVSNFLNIPIDYTIAVDMGGFIDLVNSVGGITVVPNTTFEINGNYFEGGVPTNVDGEGALNYVRERYDSGGDQARQERAQEVIQEIVKKGLSPSNARNLPRFLNTAKEYISLDVGITDITVLKDSFELMSSTAENRPLVGYGEMIDGIYYEIIDEASLLEMSQAHRANLGLE